MLDRVLSARIREYAPSNPVEQENVLRNALHQQGPWAGQHITVNMSWVQENMEAAILRIDWAAARANVQRFLPLREQEGIRAWSEDFFLHHLARIKEGEDERWEVRAAIDAVVADAYGLNREQYEHVLSTFSHSSYPKAPMLCLAKFDELKKRGLDAFTKKYDPYWDVPLNENLPKPVIELPMLETPAEGSEEELFDTGIVKRDKKRKKTRK